MIRTIKSWNKVIKNSTFCGFLLSFSINAQGKSVILSMGSDHESYTEENSKSILIHPFTNGRAPKINFKSFSLVYDDSWFKESSYDLIKSKLQHPNIEPKLVTNREKPAPLRQSLTWGFFVGDRPICNTQVKSHLLSSGHPVILGKLPKVDLGEQGIDDDSWPRLDTSKQLISEKAASYGLEDAKFGEAHPCYGLKDGYLRPAWQIKARLGELSYSLIVDDSEVYQQRNLFFDLYENDPATATIEAFKSNPTDEILQFQTKVLGNSYLESEFFTTETDAYAETAVKRAYSPTHEFVYEPSDHRFDESSVFIHATRMNEYFQELGYQWSGQPVKLVLHAVLGNTKNNALYEPSSFGYQPLISLGDGDGFGLKNLAKDADVVRHEFVHHVVFDHLKSTSGESLVLHEGIADYFPMAVDNDPCLGNTICPAGSNICAIDAQCLRSADNDLKYGSDQYERLGPHLKGQLISGMLWDVSLELGHEYVTKLAFLAIQFLDSESGFTDWLVALLMADDELSQGDNACLIVQTVKKRGMESLINGVNCTDLNSIDEIKPVVEPEPIVEPEPENVESSGSSERQCGLVMAGDETYRNRQHLGILLFLLLPIFAAIMPRAFARKSK